MSPLTDAVLNVLQAEVGFPPLKAESIARVLWVTGASPEARPAMVQEIEAALAELLRAGQVEAVHSARLGARYRIMRKVQAGTGPEAA